MSAAYLLFAIRAFRSSLPMSNSTVFAPFSQIKPAEFAPDHRPAFVKGEPPQTYLCVYPFVRTPEWYLLPKEERASLLRRRHGDHRRRVAVAAVEPVLGDVVEEREERSKEKITHLQAHRRTR